MDLVGRRIEPAPKIRAAPERFASQSRPSPDCNYRSIEYSVPPVAHSSGSVSCSSPDCHLLPRLLRSQWRIGPDVWYSTEPEDDFSYLPLGDTPFTLSVESWVHEKGDIAVDLYFSEGTENPVALFLPGAFVVKERYPGGTHPGQPWIAGDCAATRGLCTLLCGRAGLAGVERARGRLDLEGSC